jgi:hypothetical protein
MRIPCVIALGLLGVANLPSQGDDNDAAKATYERLCQQCHGNDGDLLGYADIVPIAGIHRRYPPDVIGNLSGAFSGRVLRGRDRDQMVAFLGTLRGAKGFADPGWLMTPQMLERKAPRIHEFRVLDVRGHESYSSGHVANAVPVEPGSCLAGTTETAAWLGQIGVSPSTVVVVYDDIGGPDSACVWWRIRRAGHQWVAVLDGGWRRWVKEDRFSTTVDPRTTMVRRLNPTNYPPLPAADLQPASAPSVTFHLGQDGWQWKRTLDETGFRNYEDLIRMAGESGLQRGVAYRIDGEPKELAHLVLVLHLLGYTAKYDSRPTVLTVE